LIAERLTGAALGSASGPVYEAAVRAAALFGDAAIDLLAPAAEDPGLTPEQRTLALRWLDRLGEADLNPLLSRRLREASEAELPSLLEIAARRMGAGFGPALARAIGAQNPEPQRALLAGARALGPAGFGLLVAIARSTGLDREVRGEALAALEAGFARSDLRRVEAALSAPVELAGEEVDTAPWAPAAPAPPRAAPKKKTGGKRPAASGSKKKRPAAPSGAELLQRALGEGAAGKASLVAIAVDRQLAPTVRMRAIRHLRSDFTREEALPTFEALLADPNPKLAQLAAESIFPSLRHLSPEGVETALINLLIEHATPWVKISAIRALTYLGKDAAEAVLAKVARGLFFDLPEVQAEARRAQEIRHRR
jgi:hypothetical protein